MLPRFPHRYPDGQMFIAAVNRLHRAVLDRMLHTPGSPAHRPQPRPTSSRAGEYARLIGNARTGRLLGAQVVGRNDAAADTNRASSVRAG